MKSKQKIKNIILTICCLLFFVIKATMIVNAGNGESITLGRGIATDNTKYERKVNATSVYAECILVQRISSSSMTSCKGMVQGSKKDDGSTVAVPGESLTYTFVEGTKHEMINSVYEQDFPYARIHFTGDKYSDYTIFTFNWRSMLTYP